MSAAPCAKSVAGSTVVDRVPVTYARRQRPANLLGASRPPPGPPEGIVADRSAAAQGSVIVWKPTAMCARRTHAGRRSPHSTRG